MLSNVDVLSHFMIFIEIWNHVYSDTNCLLQCLPKERFHITVLHEVTNTSNNCYGWIVQETTCICNTVTRISLCTISFYQRKKWKAESSTFYFLSVDDPTENAQGEYSNEAMSGDNGVYYNTADFTTDIKTEELLSVISEKNTKENNVFLVEYKVFFMTVWF